MRNSKGQFIKGHKSLFISHSEETKQKIRESHLGKKSTEESKEKNRLAHLGKIPSEESRIKMSLASLGKSKSEEHKKNLSIATKGLNTWSKGEKCHFWKNGAMKNYPELYAFRKTAKYRILMKETKARDDYRCFWCGERGSRLHSDHILPFIDYPRLRLEPNNIQTLCVNCHKIKTKGDRIGIYVFN